VLAVDAKTGKVLWHFNTIPQDEKDQGWEIAGPTWVGGERNGGGIWETPSIDPELGLLYVAVANPFGDSTKRAGINLFTDSIIALTLDTGRLKWYFQQTHHDVWDFDSGNQPILFDMEVRGQRVKALAEASKNGFLYILNRETGKPVHPIKEVPVPTETTREGEQPWPTQPIPYTAAGKPMAPVSPVFPVDIPAEHIAKNKLTLVPMFTPPGPNQVSAPGTGGGANYGPISYSPRTGLLYVNAIDQPNNSGRGPRGYFSAFDPTTGELAWQRTFEGFGQAGSVATASDLVFVGSGSNIAGYFFAYHAKTGEPLWKFNTGSGVFSSPSVYMVNGEQFVTVGSGGGERGRRGGDLILSFALPKP
jgi:alcohol dehydrogenase (cytochrome c)